MSDRLLAVVLALVLALPLFVSLDSDLFAPRMQAEVPTAPQLDGTSPESASSKSASPESLALEEEVMAREVMEAAKRFSQLAIEAMERQTLGLEDAVTWRSPPTPASAPTPPSDSDAH